MCERKAAVPLGRSRSTTARGCRERVLAVVSEGRGVASRSAGPAVHSERQCRRRIYPARMRGAPTLEPSVLVREIGYAIAG